ncbi:Peroxiredoxin [Amycolatopsis pretoriensis]|uniref:Peroxiredoxin n=1 Tax=Amycolatopsis pretoriensis TaxID=218821 RepID=A0A1H5QPQ3_9PSEU|nr:redoxin domain-containing protein [Amycolatopsis pretoriensis]SEF27291.1 Peroxiredoxin [Amycolatopsis pretoriensis]
MFETGSTAPSMVLEDTSGQDVRIPGRDAVLLYFMRSTSCPICNRHVRDLIGSAVGVRVLVVVPEDRARAAAWKAERGIPFPVLTGRHDSPHEMIGLSRKVFGSMQQSGSVLIDAHGVIRHAHGATLPTNSYDKKGITAAIAALIRGPGTSPVPAG